MKIKIALCDDDARALPVIAGAAESAFNSQGIQTEIYRFSSGPELLQACIPLNGCETGKAKITPGFMLPAKFVIHTPGPVYRDGRHGEPALLEACYKNCLALAEENDCETVAFPAISTGVYGYPWEAATEIAVKTVCGYPNQKVKKVIFCCFSSQMEEIYSRIVANSR